MSQLCRECLEWKKKKLKNPSKPQSKKNKPANPSPLSLPVIFSLPRQITDLFGLLYRMYAQIYTRMLKLPLHCMKRKLFLAYFFHISLRCLESPDISGMSVFMTINLFYFSAVVSIAISCFTSCPAVQIFQINNLFWKNSDIIIPR